MRRRGRPAAALALVALSLLGAGPATAAGTNLVGTFALTPGACQSGAASGTYFRMVQPSGTVANGPFVSNGDSTCADKTYTLLAPGSDGGLVTGGYQPAPSPAFDAQGNSLSNRIVVPAVFFGVKFSISTDPKDRQSGVAVTAPAIQVDPSGKLTGDLRAWEATWNKQDFNQGAPKPDGSTPKLTTAAHGTYNATTGAFVLEWTSTSWAGRSTSSPARGISPARSANATQRPRARPRRPSSPRRKQHPASGGATATTARRRRPGGHAPQPTRRPTPIRQRGRRQGRRRGVREGMEATGLADCCYRHSRGRRRPRAAPGRRGERPPTARRE